MLARQGPWMRYVQFLVLSITIVLAVWIAGAPRSLRASMLTSTQGGIVDPQKRPPVGDRTSPLLEKMTPAQRHHSQMFD